MVPLISSLTAVPQITSQVPSAGSYSRHRGRPWWFPSLPRASQVVLVIKNLPANAGDTRDAGPIPGLGRSPEGGNGTPLQYSCQENAMGRGARQAIVHRATESQTWLSAHTQPIRAHNNAVCPKAGLEAGRPGRLSQQLRDCEGSNARDGRKCFYSKVLWKSL